jgi:hypothetical protein
MDSLKNVTGTWQGAYSYEPLDRMSKREPVPFTLILKQGWFGRFTGGVTEDADRGMPGTGAIDGYFSYPRIEFTKRMPVSYVRTVDGRKISLRDFVIEEGQLCEHDVPHRPIFYRGEFPDCNHAQGTWIISAGPIPLGDGRIVKVAESKGSWSMEIAANE